MRLNENALNLSAYAMEFRVFLHRDRIYPARIQGRILVLTRCFLVFHSYEIWYIFMLVYITCIIRIIDKKVNKSLPSGRVEGRL